MPNQFAAVRTLLLAVARLTLAIILRARDCNLSQAKLFLFVFAALAHVQLRHGKALVAMEKAALSPWGRIREIEKVDRLKVPRASIGAT